MSETTEAMWQPDADGTPPPWPDPICPRAPQCRADRVDALHEGRRAAFREAAEMAEAKARKITHDQYDMDLAGRAAKRAALLGIAAAYRAKASPTPAEGE